MDMKAIRWILPAGIGAALGILWLWLIRPVWGICIDVLEGTPGGGCFSGTNDGPAILFTVLLVVELIALVLLALLYKGARRPELLGSIAGFMVVTLLVGVGITVSGVWVPPYPFP
jgi:hypothetical protein